MLTMQKKKKNSLLKCLQEFKFSFWIDVSLFLTCKRQWRSRNYHFFQLFIQSFILFIIFLLLHHTTTSRGHLLQRPHTYTQTAQMMILLIIIQIWWHLQTSTTWIFVIAADTAGCAPSAIGGSMAFRNNTLTYDSPCIHGICYASLD